MNDHETQAHLRQLYQQGAMDTPPPTDMDLLRAQRRRRKLGVRLLLGFLFLLAAVLYFGFQYYVGL